MTNCNYNTTLCSILQYIWLYFLKGRTYKARNKNRESQVDFIYNPKQKFVLG